MTRTTFCENPPPTAGLECLNPATPLGQSLARLQDSIRKNRQTPATPPPEQGTKASASSPSAESAGPKRMPQKLRWDEMPLSQSREAQEQLTRLLTQTYASQQTYGDKAAMMEYRDGMFQMVLAECSFRQIREAFLQHVRESSSLPAPSDIYRRIVPPEPEPDWAAYVGLKEQRKQDVYLTREQRDYLTWCEEWAIRRKRDYDARMDEILKYQQRISHDEGETL